MREMDDVYREEVAELLEKLESSLLLLDITPDDEELIEEIFRSMHTIKGSSSMFGYDRVAEFVHHLESAFDQVREGKIIVTKELINVTFQSLDHIRNVVDDTELAVTKNMETHQSLIKVICIVKNTVK